MTTTTAPKATRLRWLDASIAAAAVGVLLLGVTIGAVWGGTRPAVADVLAAATVACVAVSAYARHRGLRLRPHNPAPPVDDLPPVPPPLRVCHMEARWCNGDPDDPGDTYGTDDAASPGWVAYARMSDGTLAWVDGPYRFFRDADAVTVTQAARKLGLNP